MDSRPLPLDFVQRHRQKTQTPACSGHGRFKREIKLKKNLPKSIQKFRRSQQRGGGGRTIAPPPKYAPLAVTVRATPARSPDSTDQRYAGTELDTVVDSFMQGPNGASTQFKSGLLGAHVHDEGDILTPQFVSVFRAMCNGAPSCCRVHSSVLHFYYDKIGIMPSCHLFLHVLYFIMSKSLNFIMHLVVTRKKIKLVPPCRPKVLYSM